jgi:pyruvate formate lyase activating enzyme
VIPFQKGYHLDSFPTVVEKGDHLFMESKKLQNNVEERGVFFNIQRFSLHDGPGIRTTVFMKGCPLRCLWCSNPESQDISPNLIVRDIQCKGCGACKEICPQGAITLNHNGVREIDWHICDQCLLCVDACLYGSLNVSGKNLGIHEVLSEVMRDEAFYKNSGGGVTISGGEPLLQIDFLMKLLETFKDRGLHTAVDTSGHVPWAHFERIIPYVDLILFDIKHLDPKEHLRTTGVDNRLILENLEKLKGSKSIWLRLPLISNFNDSKAHIRRVAVLGKRVGAEKVSLLPYHEGGKTKCEQMGKTYPFSGVDKPSDEHVEELRKILEAEDLRVNVGN